MSVVMEDVILLKDVQKWLEDACSTDLTRPVLTRMAYFEQYNATVATDGFRVHRVNGKLTVPVEGYPNVIELIEPMVANQAEEYVTLTLFNHGGAETKENGKAMKQFLKFIASNGHKGVTLSTKRGRKKLIMKAVSGDSLREPTYTALASFPTATAASEDTHVTVNPKYLNAAIMQKPQDVWPIILSLPKRKVLVEKRSRPVIVEYPRLDAVAYVLPVRDW